MGYLDSLDIANRALQYTGGEQIASVTEDTVNNFEAAFAYDKLRRVELRRNIWRFAIRHAALRPIDVDTMILQPSQWNGGTLYLIGAIVADANNFLWSSAIPDNLGNPPGGNNDKWEPYFGPMTVEPYDTTGTTAYFSGELVYEPGAVSGSFVIYQSQINANADVPSTATVYSATVTYHSDAVVSYGGFQWRSRIEVNFGNTPTEGPSSFIFNTVYALNAQVTGSDGVIYTSRLNGNVGNDPTTDGGVNWTNTNTFNAWDKVPTLPIASTNWRAIAATMQNLKMLYPINTGPASQSETRNVYRLPAGYLKVAPQDPKAGAVAFLGASTNNRYMDWDFEGQYIVAREAYPILFRFVADVTTVSQMDDMFCEGLACRIAAGITPRTTQSEAKLQTIMSEYKMFMGEARTVNAIEIGPVEDDEDSWVSCRI